MTPARGTVGWRVTPMVAAFVVLPVLAACGLSSTGGASGSALQVVAAENFWGSIAAQIGGAHAHVTSIIANPSTDPHDYEATPGDARLIAEAGYVIVNGAGYDPWAPKLLDATPVAGRVVLTVADLFGKHDGDNPHMWYSASYVDQVVHRIATDLGNADPADRAYFQQQGAQLETVGLMAYHETITTIRRRYAGTRVGATESAVSYLATGLGLDLVTPESYLRAISEGSDPSAADTAEVEREIASRAIKLLVFDTQNSTPGVQAVVSMAQAQGIAVVRITETLTPAGATFQAWQGAQLVALLQALGG